MNQEPIVLEPYLFLIIVVDLSVTDETRTAAFVDDGNFINRLASRKSFWKFTKQLQLTLKLVKRELTDKSSQTAFITIHRFYPQVTVNTTAIPKK